MPSWPMWWTATPWTTLWLAWSAMMPFSPLVTVNPLSVQWSAPSRWSTYPSLRVSPPQHRPARPAERDPLAGRARAAQHELALVDAVGQLDALAPDGLVEGPLELPGRADGDRPPRSPLALAPGGGLAGLGDAGRPQGADAGPDGGHGDGGRPGRRHRRRAGRLAGSVPGHQ